jgi:single-stranded-DNA-specific exonuclease
MTAKPPRETAWILERPDPEAALSLSRETGTSPLVGQILINRGIREVEEARRFLHPSLTDLDDPFAIPGLDAAAARLAVATRGRERVVVYGDYDVDGISGTALLTSFLNMLGARTTSYLPHRSDEGYGLNEAAVRRIAGDGNSLLVTVDHGTTAVAEIAVARELKMDVLVLDHHTPGEELPDANAVVNPHLAGNAGLCGVGVAFKVAWGLARELAGSPRVPQAHRDFLMGSLALVALGTVADVVPLRGENRILTHFGLKQLAETDSVGIRALFAVCGLGKGLPTAVDIGFKLGPRINAAGRLGNAGLALELLLTDSTDRAREIAATLERENRRRRDIEAKILTQAVSRVEQEYPEDHLGGIALGDERWHAGVIGIVASRLVGRFRLPTALAAFDGEIGRGSCRSIPALPLVTALAECEEYLLSYGGHAAAAGFTIHVSRFEEFARAFSEAVARRLTPKDLIRPIRIDQTTPLSAITSAGIRDLERIGPFGEGNPEPTFATRGLKVAGRPRRMGKKGDHLSFLVHDGTVTFRAIGFRMGDLATMVEKSEEGVDIAYTPGFDDYRKDGSIELRLRDVVSHNGRPDD